jgi:hypothetical protein
MEHRDRNCSGRSMAGLLAGCVVGRAVGWLAIRTLQQRWSEVLCAYGYVAVGKARQAEQAVNESRRLERGARKRLALCFAHTTQLNNPPSLNFRLGPAECQQTKGEQCDICILVTTRCH